MPVPGTNGEVDVIGYCVEAPNRYASFVILIPQSQEKNLGLFPSARLRQADGLRCFAALNMTEEEEP